MNRVAQLGPRAALLLGMLIEGPLTAVELFDRVDVARELDLDSLDEVISDVLGFRPGATSITVQGILCGGTPEVLRQLLRLEDAGVVGRLGEPAYDGRCLWWVLPPSEWRTSG